MAIATTNATVFQLNKCTHMKDIYPINHWIKTHGDIALDLVRIYLGIGLILKSVYLMGHSDYFLKMMDVAGSMWFAPALALHYIVLAHVCGGILLIFGMFTRTAALVQIPVLLAALFYVHLPQMAASIDARQSVEFEGLVLFLLVLLSIYGAGRWSVDYAWSRKEHPELYEGDSRAVKPA